jgi:hypothetical protein
MAASIAEITREVVDLPRHQRLALVRLFSISINPERATRSNRRGIRRFAPA